MNLKEHIEAKRGNATILSEKIGVSLSYLSQLAVEGAQVSPIRAVEIEQATGGEVTRQELRPDDWARIWPELAA